MLNKIESDQLMIDIIADMCNADLMNRSNKIKVHELEYMGLLLDIIEFAKVGQDSD